MKRDRYRKRIGFTPVDFGSRSGVTSLDKGFTLVELLTALAVVGVLLALVIPALTAVQKSAVNVKQKAQFHTIGLGLEAFQSDTGSYPPSEYSTAYGYYTPSQRLAEALIGRDGLGFHQESVFNETGRSGTKPLYCNDSDYNSYYSTPELKAANLSARFGPYLELENANAVQLGSIYASVDSLAAGTFVLVDVFGKVKHRGTGKQTGMPILYYKADKTKTSYTTTDPAASTYNVLESVAVVNAATLKGIVSQAVPFLAGSSHPLKTDYSTFYTVTANPNFTNPVRPYRAESFILHSAGPDGLYGTMDDVFNFDSER